MNPQASKVSVIVPIFNSETTLAECLTSVVNQTHRKLEIICVNDGSSDSSPNILEAFQREDSRIIAVHQSNKGLSAARNAGLDCATGDLVIFLDSDDLLDVHSIETLVNVMTLERLDSLFFESRALEANPAAESVVSSDHQSMVESGPGFLTRDLLRRGWQPNACHQISARKFIESNKLRFEDAILHEDNLYTGLLLLRAKRVAWINQALHVTRATPGSITRGTQRAEHVIGLLVCHSELHRHFLKRARRFQLSEKIAFHLVLENIMSNAVDKFLRIQPSERDRLWRAIFEHQLAKRTIAQFILRIPSLITLVYQIRRKIGGIGLTVLTEYRASGLAK